MNRLKVYLEEAELHVKRLEDVLERLKKFYPFDVKKLENLTSQQQDMLDTLAFRFAKLQDLLGVKIFREFLKEMGFVTEGKSFLEILKEIEKEKIIDIDTWHEFRKIRNFISHDYPYNEEEKVEAINYLIQKVPELIKVVRKIESKIKGRGN